MQESLIISGRNESVSGYVKDKYFDNQVISAEAELYLKMKLEPFPVYRRRRLRRQRRESKSAF